jgi:hypothetical protein
MCMILKYLDWYTLAVNLKQECFERSSFVAASNSNCAADACCAAAGRSPEGTLCNKGLAVSYLLLNCSYRRLCQNRRPKISTTISATNTYVKQSRLSVNYFDSQAFTSPATNMNGFEFAALYKLQHGLARDAKFHRGLQHRQIPRRCKRARSSSLRRIRQGAPGVICSPAIKPSLVLSVTRSPGEAPLAARSAGYCDNGAGCQPDSP